MGKKADWQKECIEAFEESKAHLISKGGASVSKHVINEILEIEDFPTEADAIHPVQEEKLLKAIFFAHAHAVENVISTIIQMLKDGVLEANGDKAHKVAKKLRQQDEDIADEDLELEPDGDDEEDDSPYNLSDDEN